jgi:hypothetical protein
MRNIVVDEEEEEQMNEELRAVLGYKGPDAHDAAECYWLFANFNVVVNTE